MKEKSGGGVYTARQASARTMSPRDDFELGAGRAARSTAAVAAAIRGRPLDLVHDLLGVVAAWRAW